MASNAATLRLLGRLPPEISVVQIADDVFAVDPLHEEAVRYAFRSQPQIAYFLNRRLYASEVRLGIADKAWVLHRDEAVPGALAMINCAKETNGTTIATQPADVRIPYVVAASSIKGEWFGTKGMYGGGLPYELLGGLRFSSRSRSYGPYNVDKMLEWRTSEPPPRGHGVSINPAAIESSSPWSAPCDPQRVTVTDVSPSMSLRTKYLVIAGPAVCEYAEFLPGFEFVVGDYVDVAERVEAVISHLRADPALPAAAKDKLAGLDKAVADMKAKAGAKLVAFRGSSEFEPLFFWPTASAMIGGDMSKIVPDGEVITESSLAEGRSSWASSDWCVSALDKGFSVDAVREVAASSGPVTFTASTAGKCHLRNGLGTVSVDLTALVELVCAYKLSGVSVTVDDSRVDIDALDRPIYDEAKRLAAKTNFTADDVPTTLNEAQLGDLLGEAICSRLLTKAVFTRDEEALVLPTLSPQYFWTKYARERVTL